MRKTTRKSGARSRDEWIRFAFTLGFNLPFWALLLGACALVAAGSSMILLGVAGPGRLVPPAAGLTAAVVLTLMAMICVGVRRRRLDELGRTAERDSGHLAFTWFSLVGGAWATLAHLGFMAAPTPLHWLAMIWAFSFAGGINAAARKGVFDPPAETSSSPDGSSASQA